MTGVADRVDPLRIRENLLNMVRIKSVYSHEEKMVDYLLDFLPRFANRVEHQPVRGCAGNVIAQFGPTDGPRLLLMSHMDTVEVMSGWTKSPWGEVQGDLIFGLGSWDAKGCLAAMIEAAVVASSAGDEGIGITLAAVCDEEGFSRGTYELIKGGKLSGVAGAVVGEPTGEKIGVGAYGRFVLDVKVIGRAGPDVEEGVNAIIEAAKLVLWASEFPKLPKSCGGTVAPLSIKSRELMITHPDLCVLRVDRHYPPGEDEQSAKRKFISHLKRAPNLRAHLEVDVMDRPTPFLTPYRLSEDEPIVRAAGETGREIFGREPETVVLRYVTDANYLSTLAGIPTITLGPKGGNMHSPDEHVSFSSVVALAKIISSRPENISTYLPNVGKLR